MRIVRGRLVRAVPFVAVVALGCDSGDVDPGDLDVGEEDGGPWDFGPFDAGTDPEVEDAAPPAEDAAVVDAGPDPDEGWPWVQRWEGLVFEGTAETPAARVDLPIPDGATLNHLEVSYSVHIGVVEAGKRHQFDFTCADWRHPYRGGLFGFLFIANEIGSFVFRNGRPGEGAVDGPTRIPFHGPEATDLEIDLVWDAVLGEVTVTVTDPATGETASRTSDEKVEPTWVDTAVTLYLGYSEATPDEAHNIGWRYSDLTVRAAP